jgi:diaminohydroxyphosphoribosylaminopyrimidine deaminase / 5-amino-6-(5-phosphoribosylamino)uracil reductase
MELVCVFRTRVAAEPVRSIMQFNGSAERNGVSAPRFFRWRLSPESRYALAVSDAHLMRLALRLARRGYGTTFPNPMVGAVLVKDGKIIGRGWHRRAGEPHAEVEAMRDAQKHGHSAKGATLYVTLEPCCTHGRTPPCTEAVIAAGIKRVAVGATDPNPLHSGKAFKLLRRAGVDVVWWGERPREPKHGSSAASPRQNIADKCVQLNEAFNHWIVHQTPFVTVKAAMTLDGKIATVAGESKWITGEAARAYGMKLRQGADAILVGINTVLADDPSLTVRLAKAGNIQHPKLRRMVLDSMARTPLNAKVISDEQAELTTVVVSSRAPTRRVAALKKRVRVIVVPPVKPGTRNSKSETPLDLRWLLKELGKENVVSLLVEGGGEANASFLFGGFAHNVAFFYAPKILGGSNSRKAVGGDGAGNWREILNFKNVEWRRLGSDLMLSGRLESKL